MSEIGRLAEGLPEQAHLVVQRRHLAPQPAHVRARRQVEQVPGALAEAVDPPPQPARVEVDPAEVTVPTLVVSGAHDVQHFRDLAALLAREIPGAELVELDWAGHLPALERPDDMAALLRSRLGG